MGNNRRNSKHYQDALRRFDPQQQHTPGEAVDLVKSLTWAKFDETVELAVRLGVDPRQADQIVRGTVGLRGLMPNPKTGTVTDDVGRAVREFKGGRVEYRTDRYGNIHVPIGKVSFERRALLENIRAVVDELIRAKPAAAKGRYMRGITVASTLGPGVKVDPNPMRALEDELTQSFS